MLEKLKFCVKHFAKFSSENLQGVIFLIFKVCINWNRTISETVNIIYSIVQYSAVQQYVTDEYNTEEYIAVQQYGTDEYSTEEYSAVQQFGTDEYSTE